jgi:transcriptional regulator with XRE-family HTH domain
MPKGFESDSRLNLLLRKHRLHLRLYARIARRLGVTLSYVSKVASGNKNSPTIRRALMKELERIERQP